MEHALKTDDPTRAYANPAGQKLATERAKRQRRQRVANYMYRNFVEDPAQAGAACVLRAFRALPSLTLLPLRLLASLCRVSCARCPQTSCQHGLFPNMLWGAREGPGISPLPTHVFRAPCILCANRRLCSPGGQRLRPAPVHRRPAGRGQQPALDARRAPAVGRGGAGALRGAERPRRGQLCQRQWLPARPLSAAERARVQRRALRSRRTIASLPSRGARNGRGRRGQGGEHVCAQ